ncbi:MAG: YaeQ family protein [Aeromonas sp.]
MALKATIFKLNLTLSDMDKHHYQSYSLTLARHPSETDERLLIRIAAFAYHAHERLEFTKGLCADDEPELWRKNYSDEIELMIELGQPDEKRLKKACHRAKEVVLYLYGGRGTEIWWKNNQGKLSQHSNLTIFELEEAQSQALTSFVERSMQLTANISEGELWLSNGQQEVTLTPRRLLGKTAAEL